MDAALARGASDGAGADDEVGDEVGDEVSDGVDENGAGLVKEETG
jgi:hypothetical protein